MSSSFDALKNCLKKLPGLGYRSAERLALHLLLSQPEDLDKLLKALEEGKENVRPCPTCGNLSEKEELCNICIDTQRDHAIVCIVEQVPDLISMERSSAYKGSYHILHGKLSPLNGIGPEQLNLKSLEERIQSGTLKEVVFALPNDIEGEATCNYIHDSILKNHSIQSSRIGFGLPSGSGITYADPVTIQSAMDGRKAYS